MSELARKPDVPTLTCPVHQDREMQLFRETKYMQVWGCWVCKSLPKKKRKVYSGILLVHKNAGLRVPTPEERIEYAARQAQAEVRAARDEQLRVEEIDRLTHGFKTEDEERLSNGGRP